MKRVFIALLALIVSGSLLISGCSSSNGTPSPTTTPPNSPPPEGWQVGQFAPDFKLPDLTGKTISFSSFRGKPILLNFWATW